MGWSKSVKTRTHISPRKVVSLWWPLAASSILMAAEMPFVNAGIARTAQPDVALAGFGLAMSLAIQTEAPILMLNGTTTALVKDHQSFRVVERFAIQLGIFVTCMSFLLSFTPLYDVVLRQWMGVPAPVADACLPALRILLLWPAPIGWRRFHQGVLIRLRRTQLISFATVVRLAISAALTLLTIFVLRLPGQAAGSLSLVIAVVIEPALITVMARKLLTSEYDANMKVSDLSHARLFHFYLPLLMVSALGIAAQPIISTGLAKAEFPTESLATWPSVWSLTGMVCGLCQPIQEVTIALAERHDALRVLRRFGLSVGLSASALLALLSLTPLSSMYFGGLIGLSPRLSAFAQSASMLMIGFPLLMSIEMTLRGILIRQQHTSAVRIAMGCFVLTLGAALLVGVLLNAGSGVQIAAVAINLGISSEVVVLSWHAITVTRAMRQVIAAAS
ncbi:MAG: hypothetical protein LC737_06350 [Chloroflexi bacterium]|nr:hypothetical protein [Chloroflexota bacterium]